MAKRHRLVIPAVIAGLVGGTAVARRRGYSGMGGDTIVRCSAGHLFTTIWIPGASFKSLRLGWKRFQRCPVGHHWSVVTPVREADLSADELATARAVHDIRIP